MKWAVKNFLKFIGIFITVMCIVIGSLFYMMEWKITKVDEATNHPYNIVFEEIGEPFLFGSATGRITLKDHGHIIQKEKMDVANDGARISKKNWKVDWHDEYVTVYIFQDEGLTIAYTISYDPNIAIKKEMNEPDCIPSYVPNKIESQIEEVKEDEDLLELEESKEMILVATYLGYDQYQIRMDAKGKLVLEMDDRYIKTNNEHEYVVIRDEVIIGFYLVEDHQVIDEHKDTW